MGDIADQMLDGSMCQGCGEYLGDGEGYATFCAGCSNRIQSDSPTLSAKEQSKQKRESNRVYSTNLLNENGVRFVSKNNGQHLIVDGTHSIIDFWPATGKFIERGGDTGRGVKNLLQLCK